MKRQIPPGENPNATNRPPDRQTQSPTMNRRLLNFLPFLTLGFATTLAIAFLMTLLDVQQGRQSQAQSGDNQDLWTITRWDRPGATQINSVHSRFSNATWGPEQAAGAPNTPKLGDQPTAWASQTPDGGPEWLILEYDKPVIPARVDVYESNAPGALFRVTLFDAQDHEIQAWAGADPSAVIPDPQATTTTNPPIPTNATPVSRIPVSLNVATKKIKIYLASDKVPGWNEIDAVGLISDKGETQWATHVTASTTYARAYPAVAQGNPEFLVPAWSGLDLPHSFKSSTATREEKTIDARGWPMLALFSETTANPTPSISPGALPAASSVNSLDLSDELTVSTPYGGGLPAIPSASTTPATIPVPLHPIWTGFVVDSLFYTLVWLALWSVLIIPRRFIREVARFRRGACIQCGYDLGYDFIQGCPECGWRRDRQPTATSRTTVSQRMNGD
jgi:hypothetical protein